MKLKVISFYSKVISLFLVLMGLSSCGTDSTGGDDYVVEYGTPSARFRVKGTLVDEADDTKTVSGIKVAIGLPYSNGTEIKRIYYFDSIVTNNTGSFDLDIVSFPTPQKFAIKYEDTDASQNGNYGLTIDTVRFEDPDFTGGSGNWYEGEVTKDLGKVKILQK
jgi:putative lipoprotein (rSAM/lipoprotein system)